MVMPQAGNFPLRRLFIVKQAGPALAGILHALVGSQLRRGHAVEYSRYEPAQRSTFRELIKVVLYVLQSFSGMLYRTVKLSGFLIVRMFVE